MKKILALFICLAALAAGSAFALDLPDALKLEGLSVSGDIHTGFRVAGGTYDKGTSIAGVESGAQTAQAFAYSDDVGNGTPFRAQLVLQYAFDNVGIKTRFRYDATPDFGTKAPSELGAINKAFIWGTVLDKKVKATAGKSLDAAWGIFYSDFTDDQVTAFDDRDGVRIEVMPIDGLNVGVFYGSKNLFAATSKTSPYTDLEEQDSRFVLGAKYDHSAFKAVVSMYHNFNDFESDSGKLARDYSANGWTFSGTTLTGNPTHLAEALPNTTNMLLGFQLKPGESLPLQVDLSVAFANLGSMTFKKAMNDGEEISNAYKKGDFNPYWSMAPKLKAAYDFNGSFSASIELTDMFIADQFYYAEFDATKLEDSGMGQLFPITINIEPGYVINESLSATCELSFKINAGGSDQFGFGFKPGVEFDLGNGASFVVYDEIVFWGQSKATNPDEGEWQGKHPGVTGDVLQNNGTSGTENTLQFDFVWSF
jgi:hypothetical protein